MKNEKKVGNFAFCRHAQTRLFAFAARLCFAVVLGVLVFLPCGCGAQLGETRAEARRRHIRNARISRDESKADIDSIMLWDTPCKLTEKRIP